MRFVNKFSIIALGAMAMVGAGVWYMMNDYRGNAQCEILSQEEYDRLLEFNSQVVVPSPINPMVVRLTINPGLRISGRHEFRVSAGTAPISPPVYSSEEYVGPFQHQIDLVLSRQYPEDNKFPRQISPTFSLMLHDARAVCAWQSERAITIPDADEIYHFRIDLLSYRRTDAMIGYEATMIR